TRGTAAVLARAGIPVTAVSKRSEGSPNAPELIEEGRIDLVINTPFGREPRTDGYFIRTAAAATGLPCITTMPGVLAAVQGSEALRSGGTEPLPLQRYHAGDPRPDPDDLVLVIDGPAGVTPGASR